MGWAASSGIRREYARFSLRIHRAALARIWRSGALDPYGHADPMPRKPRSRAAQPGRPAAPAAAPKTLLIVEDDEELRRMFRTTLLFAGYEVREAGDGLQALQFLEFETPAAVILDLGLPLVPGQLVRDEIVAHADTRRIPLVIVTGLPGDHGGPGVDCVLTKPVTPERLLQVVAGCIAAGSSIAPH
jgi:CheY-like chemotaxis protein